MLHILARMNIYSDGNTIPTGLPDLPDNVPLDPAIPERLGEFHTWLQNIQAPSLDQFFGYLETLHPVHGILLMLVGLLYMVLGLRLGRAMMTLNLAAIGAAIGGLVAIQFGMPNQAHIAAIGGAITLGVMALPLLKVSCVLSSGVLGVILGAAGWTTIVGAFQRPDLASYAWVGGAVLAVLLILLSLSLLRVAIATVTALQGAAIITCGLLALCLQDDQLRQTLYSALRPKPWLLLLPIGGCFIAGACLQCFTKGNKKE